MQNSRKSSGSGSAGRTVLMSIGIVGVMLVGIVCFWWNALMKIPKVNIPNPVLPNPNAFDFYVKAGNAVIGDKQIMDLANSKPTLAYTLAQKEALVQQNVGAINTLHQGFAYPYLNPPIRSMYTPLPYYAKFRGMARLLILQGKVRAEQGDWNGAMESDLDAVRIGEDVPHGSVLIGCLVGVACQAIGRRPMWSTVDHLNAAQSRAAATRLESIMARHYSFADTLQEEKYSGQAGLLKIFNNPKTYAALFTPVPDAPGEDQENAKPARSPAMFYFLYSKSRIMNDYTIYMDRSCEVARQPYGLHLPPPPIPTDPINSILLPVLSQARIKGVDSETQNGLLLVTLALHAYRLEHGHYPAALTELPPTYMKKLPDDPFAVHGTFKYLVQGKSYVLYSVGPDGKDDGGMPIDEPIYAAPANPQARYNIRTESRGDIVAGINQ